MAFVLKRRHRLTNLTVTLLPPDHEAAQSSSLVQFELREGDIAVDGVDPYRCSASELGIPRSLNWSKVQRRGEYPFDLPPAFKDWLRGALQVAAPNEGPLWLHLVKPYGYLGLFPWERLLAPLLDRPLLRLPDFLVDPPKQTTSVVDAALCCPSGAGNAQARASLAVRAAKAIASDGSRLCRLMLFVDPQIKTFLQTGDLPPGSVVHVYEPSGTAPESSSIFTEYVANPFNEYVATPVSNLTTKVQDTVEGWLRHRRDEESDLLSGSKMIGRAADPVNSPFLRWVRKTMQTRSLDLVHFIADGTLYVDRGALQLDRSGTGPDSGGHLVSAAEMLSFQAQLGAWAIGLSSPADNFSDIGLRQFGDTLAQVRPGPLLYHDAGADPDCTGLHAAYVFLMSPRPVMPPRGSTTFMYCEPFRVSDQTQPEATQESLSVDSVDPASQLPGQDILRGMFEKADNVPSWVAASERFVDLYKQRLAELARGGANSDQLTEIRSALGRVQDLVAKADFGGKVKL